MLLNLVSQLVSAHRLMIWGIADYQSVSADRSVWLALQTLNHCLVGLHHHLKWLKLHLPGQSSCCLRNFHADTMVSHMSQLWENPLYLQAHFLRPYIGGLKRMLYLTVGDGVH